MIVHVLTILDQNLLWGNFLM